MSCFVPQSDVLRPLEGQSEHAGHDQISQSFWTAEHQWTTIDLLHPKADDERGPITRSLWDTRQHRQAVA